MGFTPFEFKLVNNTGSDVANVPLFNPTNVLGQAASGLTYNFQLPFYATYISGTQIRVTKNGVNLFYTTTAEYTPTELAGILTTLTSETWSVVSTDSYNTFSVSSNSNTYTYLQVFGKTEIRTSSSNNLKKLSIQSDNLTGLVCGDDGIFKTIDGGENWNSIDNNNCTTVFTKANKVAVCCFTSLGLGFTSDWDSGFTVSNPAGLIAPTYYDSHFIDSSVAVFSTIYDSGKAGGKGEIYKTTNFGTSFTKVKDITGIALVAIRQITSDIVIAIGENGTILRSANAGTTWSTITSGTTNDLYSIYDLGNGTIYIGGNEIFLKSIDNGATFTTVSSARLNFYNLSFVNSLVGYAVSNGVSLLITSNGGTTWTSYTTENTIYDVYAFSQTKQITANSAGTLFILE